LRLLSLGLGRLLFLGLRLRRGLLPRRALALRLLLGRWLLGGLRLGRVVLLLFVLGTHCILALSEPAWPRKCRVGANSPSLCPTIASEMKTGMCLRPS